MKKPILGRYLYFGRTASGIIAAIAVFVLLVYLDPQKLLFLLTKVNFYIAWLLNTLIAYAMIRLTIWTTRMLDNYHPWQRSFRKRWPKQLLLAIAIPLLLCIFCVAFYFLFYQKNIFNTNYFKKYFLLDTVGIFLLNGTLFYMHQNSRNKLVEVDREFEENHNLQFPFPLTNIAYLFSSQKNAYAVDFNGVYKHLDASLIEALKALPITDFFLVRRSHIVNRAAIADVRHEKSVVMIKLLPHLSLNIYVSRHKKQAFIAWWQMNQTPRS